MLSIKFTGIETLKQIGNNLQKAFQDSLTLKGTEREIAKIDSSQNAKEFSEQRGPNGERWSARKIKAARPLLVKSGQLRESLLSPRIELDNSGSKLTVRYVGPHAFLANIHTAGAPSRNLPSRPVGGLGVEAEREIAAVAFKRIADSFGARLRQRS